MRDIIVKARLHYFIKWFSSRVIPPIPYSADGRLFNVEFKYIEPINNSLFQPSGPIIEFGGYYSDPEDDHGEHEEIVGSIGYIDIIELDDDRLQLVFITEDVMFENVINWVVNEIERTYPIETHIIDNSEDIIIQIPGENESEVERTNHDQFQTVDVSNDSTTGGNIDKMPLESLSPWERIKDHSYDRVILKLWYEGKTNREIGNKTGYAPRTVTNTISILRKKYGSKIVPKKRIIAKMIFSKNIDDNIDDKSDNL